MREESLYQDLKKSLIHEPTEGQDLALQILAPFCLSRKGGEAFVLRGYAGTGKTTLMSTLAKVLPNYQRKLVFLAPTGRAAKVLSSYTKRKAFTIHKHIYTPVSSGGKIVFRLKENGASNTIFVVDEASMIGEDLATGRSNQLLQDLISFVREGINCRLLFVGDIAQLPPVGEKVSAALSAQRLRQYYNLEVGQYELVEVVRQADQSGILHNATYLREKLPEAPFQSLELEEGADFIRIREGHELQDHLEQAYYENSRETVLLCRSNKRANQFNQEIRTRIKGLDGEIQGGEILMAVKNNYHWVEAKSPAGFIANGDLLEVLQIFDTEEKYGFRFANIRAQLVDYPEMPEVEMKIWLDALHIDAASMPYEASQKLFGEVQSAYQATKKGYKKLMQIRKDPYLNALQVKYAYAVTCHKAQGGQWEHVFIERGYIPSNELDLEYLRWLYTGITRATKKVYMIGFTDGFFK